MAEDGKIDKSFELYEDQLAFLKEMTKKYDLPDESKALRCLLNFATQDGETDEIFDEIRCLHC